MYDLLADFFQNGDRAVEFMRAFAGLVLKVPSMPAVERIAKDRQIVVALRRDPNTPTVRRLEQLHGVPKRSIAKSFAKVTGGGLQDYRVRKSRRRFVFFGALSWQDRRRR